MKNESKILAAAVLAALLMMCSSFGCAGTDQTSSQQSGAPSVSSVSDAQNTSAADESSSRNDSGGSSEDQDSSSGDKGSEASAQNSKDTSSQNSKETSSQNSRETSVQASEEESSVSVYDVSGIWEYFTEEEYITIELVENGDASVLRGADYSLGKWTIEKNIIKVKTDSEETEYTYMEEALSDKEGRVFTRKEPSAPESSTVITDDFSVYMGTWEYHIGNDFIRLIITEDGKLQKNDSYSDNTEYGTWQFESGKIKLSCGGGNLYYKYTDGTLVEEGTERVFFRM